MGRVNSPRSPSKRRGGTIRRHKMKHRGQEPRKSSFLPGVLWDYLTSDSFMYGPLICKKWQNSPDAVRYSLVGRDRETRSKSNSPVRILKDFISSHEGIMKGTEEPIKKVIGQLEGASDDSGKVVQSSYVSVHNRTTATTTVVGGRDEGDQ